MRFLKLHCTFCKKAIYREKGRTTEAKKFGWKPYCSLMCQGKSRSKKSEFTCTRMVCHKTFSRSPHDRRSTKLYCSRSCAVSTNNSQFPRRKATITQCAHCHKSFQGRQTYCSNDCKNTSQIISGEEICGRIKDFYATHGRIPMKIEFLHYNAARDRFGTWNNAIAAAGFKPNPVMFAQKYIARDGHKCDSLAEKIIDDWFLERNIIHERSMPYPGDTRLTADFIVGNLWIEFFGLAGELKKYDELLKRKRLVCEKYNLHLIELYPKDIIPITKLSRIFARLKQPYTDA